MVTSNLGFFDMALLTAPANCCKLGTEITFKRSYFGVDYRKKKAICRVKATYFVNKIM